MAREEKHRVPSAGHKAIPFAWGWPVRGQGAVRESWATLLRTWSRRFFEDRQSQ